MNRALNNSYDLERLFKDYGRANQFSLWGYVALFEHLEQYEEETGESLTVDPVSLSCDFTEYDSATEAVSELFGSATVMTDGEQFITEEEALELLEEQKTVIRVADHISTGGLRVIVREG
jgi:hypothetical protein